MKCWYSGPNLTAETRNKFSNWIRGEESSPVTVPVTVGHAEEDEQEDEEEEDGTEHAVDNGRGDGDGDRAESSHCLHQEDCQFRELVYSFGYKVWKLLVEKMYINN